MSTPGSYKSVLIIASLTDLYTYHHLGSPIAAATDRALERVTIVLVSPLFAGGKPLSLRGPGAGPYGSLLHAPNWTAVQRLLTFAYVQASAAAHVKGHVLIEVDVLLNGAEEKLTQSLVDSAEVAYCVEGDHLPGAFLSIHDLVTLPRGNILASPIPRDDPTTGIPSLYPVVALGGTFDHLHAGHKILLTMAAWIASWKLIVGITDDALLKNKSNKHIIEDFPRRAARIRAFLTLVRPGLIYDLVAISEVAGPTAWDANVQALVVSKETLSGAAAIDKIRANNGLPPLRTFVIDVISATEMSVAGEDAEKLKAAKMSSTAIRQWIVDNQ